MLLVSMLMLLSSSAWGVDGYKDAKWGMTVKQVAALVPVQAPCERPSGNLLCGGISILGHTGTAMYKFDDGKLYAVVLDFEGDRGFFGQLESILSEKYGMPVQTTKEDELSANAEDVWAASGVIPTDAEKDRLET